MIKLKEQIKMKMENDNYIENKGIMLNLLLVKEYII